MRKGILLIYSPSPIIIRTVHSNDLLLLFYSYCIKAFVARIIKLSPIELEQWEAFIEHSASRFQKIPHFEIKWGLGVNKSF